MLARVCWVLLTDAWHLGDLHRSRPECRRTESSPDGIMFKERGGLGYKYECNRIVLSDCIAKIGLGLGQRWLCEVANAQASIFIIRPSKTMRPQPVINRLTISHRYNEPVPRNYVKRL